MQNFTIIGAGGTASHLIPALVKMTNEEDIIHIWDGDTVEDKNLERQMFEVSEVGMPKAYVYQARYGLQISSHTDYVGPDNIDRAIHEGDIVFICADNMTVRRLISEKCQSLTEVTLINGGNEMFSGSTQLYIRKAGQNLTPPITWHSPEINREDPDMAGLSCAEIAVLPGGEQTMMANMTVAALMLHAYWQSIVRWLPHAVPDKAPTKVTFDLREAIWQASDVRMQGEDWR